MSLKMQPLLSDQDTQQPLDTEMPPYENEKSVMESVRLSRTLSMQMNEETEIIASKSSIVGCVFNYTNSIIGAGIIGLPYALHIAGFYYGIILLILVSLLIDYGVRHLVECGVSKNKLDYELIVEYQFGKRGYYTVTLFMFLFAYGAMVAYHIVIGDTITPIVHYANTNGDYHKIYNQRWFIITIFSIIFMLPLSLLKNMSALSWTSGISIVAVVIIVTCVCIEAPLNCSHIDHNQPIPFIQFGFFSAIGTMSFAFVCHHNSFIVYNSLQNANKLRWKIVSNSSVAISVILSLILSIIGYLSFRDETFSDILNNFDFRNIIISISRILLSITMVFTFPMEQFVSRHCVMEILESVFHKFDSNDVKNKSKKYLMYLYSVTLILWSTSLIIGASAKDLGFVLSINGSLCASSLGYIIPALVIIKTNNLWINRKNIWNTKQFLIVFFMLIFGVVALIAGTVSTLATLWQ
eukprot:8903_1